MIHLYIYDKITFLYDTLNNDSNSIKRKATGYFYIVKYGNKYRDSSYCKTIYSTIDSHNYITDISLNNLINFIFHKLTTDYNNLGLVYENGAFVNRKSGDFIAINISKIDDGVAKINNDNLKIYSLLDDVLKDTINIPTEVHNKILRKIKLDKKVTLFNKENNKKGLFLVIQTYNNRSQSNYSFYQIKYATNGIYFDMSHNKKIILFFH